MFDTNAAETGFAEIRWYAVPRSHVKVQYSQPLLARIHAPLYETYARATGGGPARQAERAWWMLLDVYSRYYRLMRMIVHKSAKARIKSVARR